MNKIKITLTMTPREAEYLEQACYIEEDFEHSKFLNHVSQTARKARHAFEDATVKCAACGGVGVVANHLKKTVHKCKTCTGSGRVRR